MRTLGTLVLTAGLVMGTGFPAAGQHRQNNTQQRSNNVQQRSTNSTHFYDGANQGVHGGNYDSPRSGRRDYRNNQGGIGPGKSAAIGGAAGAALGALFGGGVQGALITGAAGAGIGAIIGQSAQNNRNNDYGR